MNGAYTNDGPMPYLLSVNSLPNTTLGTRWIDLWSTSDVLCR